MNGKTDTAKIDPLIRKLADDIGDEQDDEDICEVPLDVLQELQGGERLDDGAKKSASDDNYAIVQEADDDNDKVEEYSDEESESDSSSSDDEDYRSLEKKYKYQRRKYKKQKKKNKQQEKKCEAVIEEKKKELEEKEKELKAIEEQHKKELEAKEALIHEQKQAYQKEVQMREAILCAQPQQEISNQVKTSMEEEKAEYKRTTVSMIEALKRKYEDELQALTTTRNEGESQMIKQQEIAMNILERALKRQRQQ
jgi:hypothetical protein